jgi:hypothetical protein
MSHCPPLSLCVRPEQPRKCLLYSILLHLPMSYYFFKFGKSNRAFSLDTTLHISIFIRVYNNPLTSRLFPKYNLPPTCIWLIPKKIHVELVKRKQKVHQIHAKSDKNLQVENMFHLIYKWGCLSCQSHSSPSYIEITQFMKTWGHNLVAKSGSRSQHIGFDLAHCPHCLVIVGKYMQHQSHM